MQRSQARVRGVITALGTPLDASENLHEEAMRLQVEAQIAAGVDGLLCLGTMGLAQMHTAGVRDRAARVAIEASAGRVPVLVGCGDCSTRRTLEYVSAAERARPDGVVLIAPYFPKLSEGELFDYFRDVASATPLPVYVYDTPAYTHHHLSFELIKRLSAEAENVAGLKASGDFGVLRECIEHFEGTGFAVLSGHSGLLDLAVLAGASGVVDGLFAIAPRLGVRLFEAASRGDVVEARACQVKLVRVRGLLDVGSVFASFSHVMNLLGFPGDFFCPPMKGLSEEDKERLAEMLAAVDLA
jgi:4-hydroxy-tetrahydrodipicolinate synthase